MKFNVFGKAALTAIGFCLASTASAVRAQVVLLEDNFDTENGGNDVNNFFGFQNWIVEDGSVDLIGDGRNFFPGNGIYLDLDGTTGNAGRLVSRDLFAFDVGDTIQLSFDLLGINPFGGFANNEVEVSLGNLFEETFTTDDIGTVFRDIAVDAPIADLALVFDHAGGDNGGLILDNVRLAVTSAEEPLPVAEPTSAIALLGLAAASLGKMARDRKTRRS